MSKNILSDPECLPRVHVNKKLKNELHSQKTTSLKIPITILRIPDKYVGYKIPL